MEPRIFRTLREMKEYIDEVKEYSLSSNKRQFYLEREVAQMKLLQASGDRVPNGVLFGTDFVSSFGLTIDFTKTNVVGSLFTTDPGNAFVRDHGIKVDDIIVNTTRANALRIVKTVPSTEHFTYDTVAAQAIGDTIKHYAYGQLLDAQLGTTQTKLIIPDHGLKVGDYIINVTRANAVRQVKGVTDAHTLTIDSVSSQSINDDIKTYKYVRDLTLIGSTVIPIASNLGFQIDQEVTIYDDTKMEDVLITSVGDNEITVSQVLQSYKPNASVARSTIEADGSFGKWTTVGLKEGRIRFQTDQQYREIAAFIQHDSDIELEGLDMNLSYVEGSVDVTVLEI